MPKVFQLACHPFNTTKTIYGVINFSVIFKIMTVYNLKFIKVTHEIENASFRFMVSISEKRHNMIFIFFL